MVIVSVNVFENITIKYIFSRLFSWYNILFCSSKSLLIFHSLCVLSSLPVSSVHLLNKCILDFHTIHFESEWKNKKNFLVQLICTKNYSLVQWKEKMMNFQLYSWKKENVYDFIIILFLYTPIDKTIQKNFFNQILILVYLHWHSSISIKFLLKFYCVCVFWRQMPFCTLLTWLMVSFFRWCLVPTWPTAVVSGPAFHCFSQLVAFFDKFFNVDWTKFCLLESGSTFLTAHFGWIYSLDSSFCVGVFLPWQKPFV